MGPKAFGHTHHGLDAAHVFNRPDVALVYSALNLNLTALERRLPFLKCTVARRSRLQNVNGAQNARVAAAHSSSNNELCQLSDCLLVILQSLEIHFDTALPSRLCQPGPEHNLIIVAGQRSPDL